VLLELLDGIFNERFLKNKKRLQNKKNVKNVKNVEVIIKRKKRFSTSML